MAEQEIGKITHYFGNIGVAVVKLSGTLKVGDTIRVKGATSDFTQKIAEIQVDHKPVKEASRGMDIGLRVVEHAREHDAVLKVEE